MLFRFRYNSYHKIITACLVAGWAIFHFSKADTDHFYENGQIKRSGEIVNGQNHGRWTWYYENGNKEMEGMFERGKRTGIWTTWDRDGRKLTEANYEADRLNGAYKAWSQDGSILVRWYRNDVPVAAPGP